MLGSNNYFVIKVDAELIIMTKLAIIAANLRL